MRRVLVTGGAGFLGSHLCDRLIARGDEVVCLDNFFTGAKTNVGHLVGHPRFELIRHDIIEPILVEVDWVFNLACPASPIHYQYNPIKTIKTSILGTMNMLGLAKRVKARFFQASTSEVYGDPTVHPQPESYWGNVNPIGIRSCYDEGKRCAETLCMDYHRSNGVDTRIVRIFNTYGPRMALRDGRVVSNFVMQALSGKPLTVYGEGNQTRSFCYCDDLIEGFLRLMEYEGPDCHEPHNIGNPGEFTMLELATLVKELTGTSLPIVHEPLPADDPKQRQPDIARTRKNLGWEPKTALREGLQKTIADFRPRVEAER
ncbi:MAG TPA: UDP-glucuronic acid decarboxylase family protein [Planctomycetia bacterium]|nr:UDP-glucuronic acid decarboxylase family protein [Planctomycetia bacterium]